MRNFLFPLVAVSLSLLVACGGQSPSQPTPVAVTSTQGKVENWNRGAGTVRLYGYSSTEATSIANAALSTSGEFNLALPSSNSVQPYLTLATNSVVDEAGCTGGFTSSNQQAQGVSFSGLSITQNGTVTASISAAKAVVKEDSTTRFVVETNGNSWIYVDRAAKLSGSVTCAETFEGTPISVNFGVDANLAQGWNIISVKGVLTVTQTSAVFDFNLRNGTNGVTTWTVDAAMSAPTALIGQSAQKVPSFNEAYGKLPLFK